MKQAAQVAESADPDKVDVAMDDLHQTGCMMDIVEVELSGEKRSCSERSETQSRDL